MTTLFDRRCVTSKNLLSFLDEAVDAGLAELAGEAPVAAGRLHGLRLQLATRNRRYAEFVRQRLCFSDEARSAEQPLGAEQSLTVAVVSPDDSRMPPPPAWGETTFHPREFERLLDGSPFRASYFHDCRHWQIYDRRRRFGLQWMAGSQSYPAWEPAAPLRAFLHWAYRFQGKRLAHAGTLGDERGGVMLTGRGGSGKSGAVVGGILHGLRSVGDDYVLIEPTEEGADVFPLFRTLKQDRAGLDRLGLGAAIAATRGANWQDKYEMNSEELSGRPLATRLKIRAIVAPKIVAAARSALRPLRKSQAMLALAPSGLFQMPGERDSGVVFFSNLVRRIPCFQLALCRDPVENSRTLESLLDGGLPCV